MTFTTANNKWLGEVRVHRPLGQRKSAMSLMSYFQLPQGVCQQQSIPSQVHSNKILERKRLLWPLKQRFVVFLSLRRWMAIKWAWRFCSLQNLLFFVHFHNELSRYQRDCQIVSYADKLWAVSSVPRGCFIWMEPRLKARRLFATKLPQIYE